MWGLFRGGAPPPPRPLGPAVPGADYPKEAGGGGGWWGGPARRGWRGAVDRRNPPPVTVAATSMFPPRAAGGTGGTEGGGRPPPGGRPGEEGARMERFPPGRLVTPWGGGASDIRLGGENAFGRRRGFLVAVRRREPPSLERRSRSSPGFLSGRDGRRGPGIWRPASRSRSAATGAFRRPASSLAVMVETYHRIAEGKLSRDKVIEVRGERSRGRRVGAAEHAARRGPGHDRRPLEPHDRVLGQHGDEPPRPRGRGGGRGPADGVVRAEGHEDLPADLPRRARRRRSGARAGVRARHDHAARGRRGSWG